MLRTFIAPDQGQLVDVRQRRYIVADVARSTLPPDPLQNGNSPPQHLITLSSVEDDALGEELQVIWEIEPGTNVTEKSSLPEPAGFDEPGRLDAFLDAVRWGAASSADVRALLSPFRSGIEIEDYQLDPVVRAIQMPRANLLIADDVGLGKTIEAGLVVQELILRHRIRTVLVVCPSSLQIQWRDQMRDKFGLEFRIVDTTLMKELRRQRGLHVNPWTHFPRLITSVDFLKRDRQLRLFTEALPAEGEPTYPRRFDLLIVDEAHNVAPSGRGRYATDSQRTQTIRRLAPRQEMQGVIQLAKDKDKEKGQPRNADIVASHQRCIVAATPGGIYTMVRDRWTNKKLSGHYLCHCLVLDEASQMNLPEAAMAALTLDLRGQLIVVGDPRQMPPIVKHDWQSERRRTFQQYKSYESLFNALLALGPPIIKFSESFRLHADMAEFLRQEIYSKDGIEYHSRKRGVLSAFEHIDPFVSAVLSPDHPIVIVLHDEAQSQTRNIFEQMLIAPILEALVQGYLYNLDSLDGIGVVVPHRAQRADMQNAFSSLRQTDPITGKARASAVDTVERFQGGERTAILVSATESDRDYLLASRDFLYDPRRLTVAISRAKQKMVLVASRSIFSLFSPDEVAFNNAQLWKNLLRRTCTHILWEGEKQGIKVEVWGNELVLPTE